MHYRIFRNAEHNKVFLWVSEHMTGDRSDQLIYLLAWCSFYEPKQVICRFTSQHYIMLCYQVWQVNLSHLNLWLLHDQILHPPQLYWQFIYNIRKLDTSFVDFFWSSIIYAIQDVWFSRTPPRFPYPRSPIFFLVVNCF